MSTSECVRFAGLREVLVSQEIRLAGIKGMDEMKSAAHHPSLSAFAGSMRVDFRAGR